jgi:hypothetical protein
LVFGAHGGLALISYSRPVSLALAVALLSTSLVLAPAPAQATPETLNRAFTNLLWAPFDMVLSPLTSANTLINNLRDVDDSTGVRVAYAVPGYGWLVGLNFAAGAMRGLAGALELIPGMVLYPFKADLDALYDPADRSPALVEIENPLAEDDVGVYFSLFNTSPRFGIDYTSTE